MLFKNVSLSGVLMVLLASNTVAEEVSTINAQVWADNWFALYVDGKLIKEDSVPYETERSFNAEDFSFSAKLPVQVSVVIKDYKENDTGLEYIGSGSQTVQRSSSQVMGQPSSKHDRSDRSSRRSGSSHGKQQQMGDGGFIAQFYDSESGKLLAASSSDWRCEVIHQAPLNRECENSSDPVNECRSLIKEPPANWMSASFDDSNWPAAVEYTERDVSPHGDYDRYDWASEASLIWSEDLKVDNTLLCRFTLTDET